MEGLIMVAPRRVLGCAFLVVAVLAASLAPLVAAGGGTGTGDAGRTSAPPAGVRSTPRLPMGRSAVAPVPDTAAPSTEPSTSPGPVIPIQVGWDALHFGTDAGLSDPYFPPDVQVAAGPVHVVEMVNLLMGVYTKQGAEVSVSSLVSLFSSGSDFISDPKVQYDAASGHWFATVTDVTAGQVLMAVSATSDPTGSWHLARIPSSSTGECLDQPILGVGTTTVIVSANVFSQTKNNPCATPYLGAQYWVVNKTDLVSGVANPAMNASAIDGNEGSIHPVQLEGTSAVHYMVSTYWPGTATTSDTLHLFTVSGTPPASVSVTVASFSMPTAALAPAASQLGTGHTIDTSDIRISDAAWAAGKLWLGFDEACLSDSARACIRMVELDTAAGAVLQDFDLDIPGKDVFYPAFRMDAIGGLEVVFGYSSSSDYPGIMATGRLPGDLANTLQAPSLVVRGTGPENPSGCSGTCRYGDYFGAGADPSNASLIWLAGEFGTTGGWSTHIFASGVKATLLFDYQVVGGGTGYSTPTVSYESNGALLHVPLTVTPTAYYADPGTPWSVTAVLINLASPDETWPLDTGAANPPHAGTANASLTATYAYYHQYAVRLGYDVQGWGGSIPLSAPMVNVTRFGQATRVPAGSGYGLDAGTTYAYENPLAMSTGNDRVATAGPANGTVTGALNLTVHYYHQFLVTFDFVLEAAGVGSAPTVHYFRFGANTSVQANATVWADAGRPYAYAPSLTTGTGEVRIGADGGAVGDITAAGTITVAYRLQYLLTVFVVPGGLAGNVSGAGWYDAGSSATLTATVPEGWQFVGWSGAASGSGPRITVAMAAPANVTALFYAGLTITSGDGGSVGYSYGAFTGLVPAGGSVTIYVPVGTAVTLIAQPSSWTETFASWHGAPGGGAEQISFTMNGPRTVAAAFGMNVLAVAGAAGGVAAVLLAVLLLVLVARRRRRRPPS